VIATHVQHEVDGDVETARSPGQVSIDLRKTEKTECLESVIASSGRKKRRGTPCVQALLLHGRTERSTAGQSPGHLLNEQGKLLLDHHQFHAPNQQHPPWQAVVLL
jgi:hypothetical protein